MGKRGPAKTPTELKVLRGTATAAQLEQQPHAPKAAGPPDPPEYLDLDAIGIWHRLAPTLHARGVLSAWDVDAFAAYCTAVVHHRRAVALVNADGVTVRVTGGRVKHPALQIVRDQAALIISLGGRFGLTPADRAAIKLTPEEDPGARGNAFA